MRLAYMDSARAVLMLLGIPYHAALVYHINGWIVQDSDTSYALSYLAEFLNLFRMPAFFLVAGFFSLLTIRKIRNESLWLRKRAVRIGVPLVCSVILILPVQAVVANWPGPIKGSNFSHLWFLVALALYSAICACTWRLWEAFSRHRLTPLLVLCLTAGLHISVTAYEASYGWLAYNLGSVLYYAPYFFIGVMFSANMEAWERATKVRWLLIAAGVPIMAAYPLLKLSGGAAVPEIYLTVAQDIATWLGTYMVLMLFRRFLNHPSKLVDSFVPAAFTIYLFHHPIIVGLARIGQHSSETPVLEWAVIVVATVALAYLVHSLVSSNWVTRLLFNGEMTRAKTTRLAAA